MAQSEWLTRAVKRGRDEGKTVNTTQISHKSSSPALTIKYRSAPGLSFVSFDIFDIYFFYSFPFPASLFAVSGAKSGDSSFFL